MTVAGALLLFMQPAQAQIGNGTAQPVPASGQGQQGQLSEKDYRFVEKAARGGQEEVQLGQLAQQRGASQQVRDFGQRMVTDHGRANDELMQLASQKGAALPTSMSHSEHSTLQHLQNLNGTSFDQAYARDMVKDHTKDVKDFQKAANDLKDPDLRAWAQKTLPVLQEHLKQAQAMEASVGARK